MDGLYPELEDYIYEYCRQFQTENEVIAGRTVLYTLTARSDSMRAIMRGKGWISDDPVILAMIADGGEALKSRVVQRVWNEHQHELTLNLCPACNKIARTPDARQCRFCLYDWHGIK
jgi:hypothetical protein